MSETKSSKKAAPAGNKSGPVTVTYKGVTYENPSKETKARLIAEEIAAVNKTTPPKKGHSKMAQKPAPPKPKKSASAVHFHRPVFPKGELGREMRRMDKNCVGEFMRQIALARHVYRLCPEFLVSKKFPKLPGDLGKICQEFNDGRGLSEQCWFKGHILLHPNYPKYLYQSVVDSQFERAASSLVSGTVLCFPLRAA